MNITVKLFASFREMFQKDSIELRVPENCTLLELTHLIGRDVPDFERVPGRWAVNLELKPLDYRLKGDEEIAWIPPVSGG